MIKKRQRSESGRRRRTAASSGETRSSDVVTVAWTLSVTTSFVCSLLAVGTHFLLNAVAEPGRLPILQTLSLFAAAAVGALSLFLLPLVYHLRRHAPPQGYLVFALCVAVAPWLAVVLRWWRL